MSTEEAKPDTTTDEDKKILRGKGRSHQPTQDKQEKTHISGLKGRQSATEPSTIQTTNLWTRQQSKTLQMKHRILKRDPPLYSARFRQSALNTVITATNAPFKYLQKYRKSPVQKVAIQPTILEKNITETGKITNNTTRHNITPQHKISQCHQNSLAMDVLCPPPKPDPNLQSCHRSKGVHQHWTLTSSSQLWGTHVYRSGTPPPPLRRRTTTSCLSKFPDRSATQIGKKSLIRIVST